MDYVTQGKKNTKSKQQLFCCNDEYLTDGMVKDRFRILLAKSGAGILCINGNKVLFHAPSIFCLNETEEVILMEHSSAQFSSVYFAPSTINSSLNFSNIRGEKRELSYTEKNDCTCLRTFYERSDNYHGLLPIDITAFKAIHSLYQSMERELSEQPDNYWPCRSRSFLIEILFILQRFFLNPGTNNGMLLNSNSDFITQVLLYLHTNYDRKITINELSRYFSMNRTTLNEKFKEEVGMTVISYLIDLRLRLACLLLRDTLIPVSEIALRVGFNDIANFTRTFGKVLQSTPSEYRQINSWQLR